MRFLCLFLVVYAGNSEELISVFSLSLRILLHLSVEQCFGDSTFSGERFLEKFLGFFVMVLLVLEVDRGNP